MRRKETINNILYGLNDICIIPKKVTHIDSRSICNVYHDDMLPLFTAPMSSVIDENNYWEFTSNRVNTIIPLTVDLETRIKLSTVTFVSMDLKEFENFIKKQKLMVSKVYHICVDIANGHMSKMLKLCKEAKEKFGGFIIIIAGNIANPDTYFRYAKAGIDGVRCSVGSGSACLTGDAKILMENLQYKKIKDIKIGDVVKTKSGDHAVLNTFSKKVNSVLKINNNITCTTDHKFYVVDKDIYEYVTEENINEYGYWVEAKDLSKDKHLLVSYVQ